jgi:DNA polymerase III delta subunit
MVILHGKELFLRHEATARLMADLRAEYGEVDVFNFSGSDANAADVLDECRSFGLIAAHKVVIVDEAEDLVKTDLRPLFERYAQNPSEGATLVLRSGNWKAGKLDKMVAKVGKMIPCKELKEGEAIGWAGRRAEEIHGVRLDRNAAQALIDRVGIGLGRIDTELAKLAIGAEKGVIRLEHVQELVAATRALEPWPLQDALLSGNAELGIRYIRDTINSAPRGVEIPLIYSATTLARDLHACTIAHQLRLSIHEVADRTGKKGTWALKNIYPRARGLNVRQTAALVTACVRADSHAKSGVGDTQRSLEMLTIGFSRVMR